MSFAFGVAALEDTGQQSPAVDTAEMLEIAGLCRNCPGHTGPEQLGAVQRSVACHVSIVCRHGYVVDNECSLKGARPHGGGRRAGTGGLKPLARRRC